MSYAVWIALAVVFIAVLPAILRGRKSDGGADTTSWDGDSSDSDSDGGGDGGD